MRIFQSLLTFSLSLTFAPQIGLSATRCDIYREPQLSLSEEQLRDVSDSLKAVLGVMATVPAREIPESFPKLMSVDRVNLRAAGIEGQNIRVYDFKSSQEKNYKLAGFRLQSDHRQRVTFSGNYMVALREATDSPFQYPFPKTMTNERGYEREVERWRESPREVLVADLSKADASGVIPEWAIAVVEMPEYSHNLKTGGRYVEDIVADGPFLLIRAEVWHGTSGKVHYLVDMGSPSGKKIVLVNYSSNGRISLAHNKDSIIVNLGSEGVPGFGGPVERMFIFDHDLNFKGKLEPESYSGVYNTNLLTAESPTGTSLLIAVRHDNKSAEIEILNLAERETIFRYHLKEPYIRAVATDGRHLFMAGDRDVKILNLATREVSSIPGIPWVTRMTVEGDKLNLVQYGPDEMIRWHDPDKHRLPRLIQIPLSMIP